MPTSPAVPEPATTVDSSRASRRSCRGPASTKLPERRPSVRLKCISVTYEPGDYVSGVPAGPPSAPAAGMLELSPGPPVGGRAFTSADSPGQRAMAGPESGTSGCLGREQQPQRSGTEAISALGSPVHITEGR